MNENLNRQPTVNTTPSESQSQSEQNSLDLKAEPLDNDNISNSSDSINLPPPCPKTPETEEIGDKVLNLDGNLTQKRQNSPNTLLRRRTTIVTEQEIEDVIRKDQRVVENLLKDIEEVVGQIRFYTEENLKMDKVSTFRTHLKLFQSSFNLFLEH